MKRASLVALALTLVCTTTARTEIDVFMRAVGFALTGSDDAEPKAVGDRTKCVFAIKNGVYRLNNVHTDRVTIQGWQRWDKLLGALKQWVTVRLHGDDAVFEEDTEPPKDDGSELMRQLRAANPDWSKSHHYSYKEHELHLTTNDQDRVKRAWDYIYAHGCIGKKSPF
jgi:hypothetical protein